MCLEGVRVEFGEAINSTDLETKPKTVSFLFLKTGKNKGSYFLFFTIKRKIKHIFNLCLFFTIKNNF